MSDRRTFLKQLSAVVGIAIATPTVVDKISNITVANKFEIGSNQRMIFRRMIDKRWIFEFVDAELFNPTYNDTLVVDVHGKTYLLKSITDIQISTEYLYGWSDGNVQDYEYIHWFSGNLWEEV